MITINDGKICIDHATVMTVRDKFKLKFPFARWRGKKWEMLATLQNIELVNKVFGAEVPVPAPEETNITEYLMQIDYKFKRDPFHHQLEALAKCNMRHFFAYLLEPGLGKTKILIDDVMILNQQGKVDNVLVVCPKSVMGVWPREITCDSNNSQIAVWPMQIPSYFGGVNWYVINHDALITNEVEMGKIKKKLDASQSREQIEELTFLLAEKEAETSGGYKTAENFLLSSSHSMMVIDESTCIVNYDSLRTRMCMRLRGGAEYRRILTGDPIANTPIDIYSQFNWLDDECVDRRNFYSFRGHFCDMGGYKNKIIVGYKNTEELKNIINVHGYRARTKDVLDMPEQNWITREVMLSPNTMKIYNSIVEDNILSLFDGRVTINTSFILTEIMKLWQLCGGTLLDDERNVHQIGNEKLNALRELLDEWHMPGVLIWHHFAEEGVMINDAIKGKYRTGVFSGGLTVEQRNRLIDDFESGEIETLIIQDDAGHLGITLNRATHAIFYSNHLRPIVRNQAERRNWRIGQKNPVFYYDLLCKGAIDSWIYDRLMKKREFNATITDNEEMTKDQVRNMCYGGYNV